MPYTEVIALSPPRTNETHKCTVRAECGVFRRVHKIAKSVF